MLRRVDPVVLLLAGVTVLFGSLVGARGDVQDIDEVVFRSTILHMQEGDGYYDAFETALREKSGIGPSQVRAVRTPVVSTLLAPFPASTWRWFAAVPALALCLAAAALAGPDLLAQRLAAGFAGLWMLTSLPLLYLHAELWGAPLTLGAALLLRRDRDLPAAGLCVLATATRELFGLALVVGLVLRRDRRAWLGALGATAVGGAIHAVWSSRILDPHGFEPPVGAMERYTHYLGPGLGIGAEVLGLLLLAAAAVGFVLKRRDPVFRYLAGFTVPLIIGTALSGRSYWSLTWCGATSAAGAVALTSLADRAGWRRTDGDAPLAPYPRP